MVRWMMTRLWILGSLRSARSNRPSLRSVNHLTTYMKKSKKQRDREFLIQNGFASEEDVHFEKLKRQRRRERWESEDSDEDFEYDEE